jgi:putative heme-binding domain-containing protein
MTAQLRIPTAIALAFLSFCLPASAAPLVYEGTEGPGKGKHVVLIAGDEEYRSEECLPMLARILAFRHGFKTTVLFSVNESGEIDPDKQTSLDHPEALDQADAIVLGLRFRQWPDEATAKFVAALDRGIPVLGLRTSTHAFKYPGDSPSPYKNFSFNSKEWPGGFGKQILGETWIAHHGTHGKEGTRSIVEPASTPSLILNGVGEIFGDSDVYTANPPEDAIILLRGIVTATLDPASPAVEGAKNSPPQPIAWTREVTRPNGAVNRVFTTTMGAATDFADEDLRRLLINATFWGLKMEASIPEKADATPVGEYKPSPFKFGGFVKGVKASDLALGEMPVQSQVQEPKEEPLPATGGLPLRRNERIALVGGGLASNQAWYAHFETTLATAFPRHRLITRNFGWPGDTVSLRQRPKDYTAIGDPLTAFAPETYICFFGFNESFDPKFNPVDFTTAYRNLLASLAKTHSPGSKPRFVLVTPLAFEPTGLPDQPDGKEINRRLATVAEAIKEFGKSDGHEVADLFAPSLARVQSSASGEKPLTRHGHLLTENGDRELSQWLFQALFPERASVAMDANFEKLRAMAVERAWMHAQDYRMLNGWYVYGNRNTFDKETYPAEIKKLRAMIAARDEWIHRCAAGEPVPDRPDDRATGSLQDPPTRLGSQYPRAEPKEPRYLSPEDSIATMKPAPGFRVECFASEREFPELANPVQINFDARGRLWVACMPTYPHWRPGDPMPSDRLLILEDTNNDGKADKRTVFYDRLHIPTGFAFWNGGVLVMDGTCIRFLRDDNGDDVADTSEIWLEGIGTDDTHHTSGAWEWSPGGFLYMLEGVSMTTSIETPWGPLISRGSSGCFILDPRTMRIRRFNTPGYGNPWSMVFDEYGNGFIGDGTSGTHHWTSLLAGAGGSGRGSSERLFDHKGLRPIVGTEILTSRHFPDEWQGRFTFACVINMNGFPAFTVGEDGAGFHGQWVAHLLESTDKTFRPVDPQIGPDGALWFGDWCNALIGHMQYSQRDPMRDKKHGRIYRLVAEGRPLLPVVDLRKASTREVLDHLITPEPRERYRARDELRARPAGETVAATRDWLVSQPADADPRLLLEALWIQQRHGRPDTDLLLAALRSDDHRVRAAGVSTLSDEVWSGSVIDALPHLRQAAGDKHPRVRLEAVRALGFYPTLEATHAALLSVAKSKPDRWLDDVLDFALRAQQSAWLDSFVGGSFAPSYNPGGVAVLESVSTTLSGDARINVPVRRMLASERENTPDFAENLAAVAALQGNPGRGRAISEQMCISCHVQDGKGVDFAPTFDGIGRRLDKKAILLSILRPGEAIAEGYQTATLTTRAGEELMGILQASDGSSVTIRTGDGKSRTIARADIARMETPPASSMPEGLAEAMTPRDLVDLISWLESRK